MSRSKNGPGEYNFWDINPKDNQVYDLSAGLPLKVASQPAKVVDVKGCLHHQAFIDDSGNAWAWGDNSSGQCGIGTVGGTVAIPTQILVDAYGNPFTGIIAIMPYANGAGAGGMGYGTAFLKADGSCWLCGNTESGFAGDGSAGSAAQTRPIKVPLPAGVFAKQFDVGMTCNVLDSAGQVWTWGGSVGQYWPPYLLAQGTDTPDASRPGKLVQQYPVIALCAGGLFNYALLERPDGTTSLIGWAYYTQYLGLQASVGRNTPFLLDQVLNLPAPIAKIAMSAVATYVILTDKTAWAWGDNACGFMGIGTELDFRTYPSPYKWDWGIMELPQKPVQIGVGLLFEEICTGLGDVFYVYATDTNGQRYSWGRNKGGVLGNGIISADPTGNETATFPNSWDVPGMTPINPYALTTAVPTPSPVNAKPSAPTTLGSVSWSVEEASTILKASGPGVPVNYWVWKQVSGPSAAQIVLPWSPSPKVNNLVPGTYVFQAKMTDNNWNIYYQDVTLTVTAVVVPSSKTVTGLQILIDGQLTPVPISGAKFTFSDGTTQG